MRAQFQDVAVTLPVLPPLVASILWVPSFQAGSYFPAVPIMLELRRRGHQITVLCEAGSEASFRSLDCAFRPTSSLDSYVAGADPSRASVAAKRRWIAGYVPALFADVAGELSSRPYDAVMADPLETGADFAAESHGVPWFSYVHFALDENGPDVPFCFHYWTRERPAAEEFTEWWNGLRAAVGLDPETRPPGDHRWYRHSPWLTLILGLPELVDRKGTLPSYAFRVGPSVWDPPRAEPLPEWLHEVGVGRPAILASVSTTRQADADLVVSVGLAAERHGMDVIATVSVEHELSGLPSNVRLTPFIPHGALIERVAIVACHSGAGTVTRAACAGVPLLLFPTGRDQFQVARGACAAGIAIEVAADQRNHPAVAEALGALIAGDRYRRRAREMALAARAYDAPSTAADHVDAILLKRIG